MLKNVSHLLPRKCRENIYKLIIRPLLDYGDVLYDVCPTNNSKVLDDIERQAALVCTGAFRNSSTDRLLAELGWELLYIRRRCHRLNYFYKIINKLCPTYLQNAFPRQIQGAPRYNFRNSRQNLPLPFSRTNFRKQSFFPQSLIYWN